MKEKNIHILKKAIQKLPDFRISKDIWPKIENSISIDGQNIEKKIDLPVFKAPDYLWNKVEEQLNLDSFKKAKQELPIFKAPDILWNDIENRIDKPPVRRINLKVIQYAAVAAVLIVLIVGIRIKSSKIKDSDITYSVEIVPDEHHEPPNTNQQDITKELCDHNPIACAKPEYMELNRQLEEVAKELDKLCKLVDRQSNPQSMKYIYMLENKRGEIEKKMIRMVLDS
jgi:hypothetical protein